jgi:hypothetical protein
MENFRGTVIWSLTLGLLLSAGCSDRKESGVTSQDVKKEAREAVQTATAFTQQQRGI